MTDEQTRRAIQTRIGWLGLAKLIPSVTAPAPQPTPRSAAAALYPHLPSAHVERK
jgi:hypothetical protein